MTFDLLNCMKFLSLAEIYMAKPSKDEELLEFHSEEYINFMKNYGDIPDDHP